MSPTRPDPSPPAKRRSAAARWGRWFDLGTWVFAGYCLASRWTGAWMWPLTLIEPCVPWLAVPIFLRLPWTIRAKRWSTFGVQILVLYHFTLPAMRRFDPRPAPPSEHGRALIVLSCNIASGLARLERLVPALRASGADVIALQELDDEEALGLKSELLDLYPHRVLHGLGIPGKGLLSRFPIVEEELFRLAGPRPYQRAVLDVEGRRWTLFSVHLPLEHVILGPFGDAEADALELARRAAAAAPALLVGDFNSTDRMRVPELVGSAGLVDSFHERGAGLGLTFPIFGRYRHLPIPRFTRIDYVWHTPDLVCLGASVAADAGSDHLPVQAVVAARKP